MTREQFEKWVDLVERTEGRVYVDRFVKDGLKYISFSFWANFDKAVERIHVVGKDEDDVVHLVGAAWHRFSSHHYPKGAEKHQKALIERRIRYCTLEG